MTFTAKEAFELYQKTAIEKEQKQLKATLDYISSVIEPKIKEACGRCETSVLIKLSDAKEILGINFIRLENELKLGGYKVSISHTREPATITEQDAGEITIKISWNTDVFVTD